MPEYLMYRPETDEDIALLTKAYKNIKSVVNNNTPCIAINEKYHLYGISLSFYEDMVLSTIYDTKEINTTEFKELVIKHATGIINLT